VIGRYAYSQLLAADYRFSLYYYQYNTFLVKSQAVSYPDIFCLLLQSKIHTPLDFCGYSYYIEILQQGEYRMSIEFVRICKWPKCEEEGTKSSISGYLCEKHYQEHVKAEIEYGEMWAEMNRQSNEEYRKDIERWKNQNKGIA
jgi:hypothetical protein